jgi:formate hydrogenlyase subunit 4
MIDTSKAFSKSQKIPRTSSLLFIAFKISVVSLQVALSVLNPTLKPHCSVLNMLLYGHIWLVINMEGLLQTAIHCDQFLVELYFTL